MALDEQDPELAQEIAQEALQTTGMERKAAQPSRTSQSALITISAGAGGDEAHDWTRMLAEMYALWAKSQGVKTETLEKVPGDLTGYRTVTIELKHPAALSALNGEKGVHRLVRNSPFDPAGKRHTSFASVTLYPTPPEESQNALLDSEIEIKAFRSSGPGGQHMQKASTAVRVTHLPTGITASAQTERSQLHNIRSAKKILQAKLDQNRQQEQQQAQAERRQANPDPSWGNRTRSYYLHPKELVTDHRTGNKSARATAILQGALHLVNHEAAPTARNSDHVSEEQ